MAFALIAVINLLIFIGEYQYLNEFSFDFPFSAKVHSFFSHYEFKRLLKNKTYFIEGAENEVIERKDIEKKVISNNDEIQIYVNKAKESKKDKNYTFLF